MAPETLLHAVWHHAPCPPRAFFAAGPLRCDQDKRFVCPSCEFFADKIFLFLIEGCLTRSHHRTTTEGLCPNRNLYPTTTQGQKGRSTMKRILDPYLPSATSLRDTYVQYIRNAQLRRAQTPLTNYRGWARSQATNLVVLLLQRSHTCTAVLHTLY